MIARTSNALKIAVVGDAMLQKPVSVATIVITGANPHARTKNPQNRQLPRRSSPQRSRQPPASRRRRPPLPRGSAQRRLPPDTLRSCVRKQNEKSRRHHRPLPQHPAHPLKVIDLSCVGPSFVGLV